MAKPRVGVRGKGARDTDARVPASAGAAKAAASACMVLARVEVDRFEAQCEVKQNIVDDEPKRVSAFWPDIVTHTVVDARLRHG